MTPDRTRAFLKALGCKVPSSQNRAGWIVSNCPLGPWRHQGGSSSSEVFGVRDEPGDARCNCFACGWHGTLHDLVLDMRERNKAAHRVTVKWADVFAEVEKAQSESTLNLDGPSYEDILTAKKGVLHPFGEWWLDTFPPVAEASACWEYLDSRHVSPDMAKELDMRFDSKEGRVCFPVRDFNGTLVGLHGRALSPETELRYRMYLHAKKNNPIVWLGESWVDLNKPIVVVEGPFDVASVKRVYPNVVSPLFVNPSIAKLKRMADASEWITLYDSGTGGDQGRAKVNEALGKDHILHHLHPPHGRKDPGEMTKEQLAEVLSSAIKHL
jgi:5S rRNA maturation endonuclease (ribonuclease M5)